MALLEDQRLVELQRERRDLAFAVGDIYLGRVKKVMPGLNAAFVDVGYKKDAFLHYLDLGMIYQAQQRFLEQIEKTKAVPSLSKIPVFPDLPKDGKIADYLKAGQNVLVKSSRSLSPPRDLVSRPRYPSQGVTSSSSPSPTRYRSVPKSNHTRSELASSNSSSA